MDSLLFFSCWCKKCLFVLSSEKYSWVLCIIIDMLSSFFIALSSSHVTVFIAGLHSVFSRYRWFQAQFRRINFKMSLLYYSLKNKHDTCQHMSLNTNSLSVPEIVLDQWNNRYIFYIWWEESLLRWMFSVWYRLVICTIPSKSKQTKTFMCSRLLLHCGVNTPIYTRIWTQLFSPLCWNSSYAGRVV